MKDTLIGVALIAGVLAFPALAVWGIGAFIQWDATWAFATADVRVKFIGAGVVGAFMMAGLLG